MRMAWLPGAYHAAQDFEAAGFTDAVRSRRTALDLIFLDLELAHVTDRSVLEQLRADIVAPARAAGVSVWLGGISFGGLLALDYAASYPGEIDGLCLLAPYLGNRLLIGEISQAPGLEAWQPGALAKTDEEHRIWGYVKNRGRHSAALHLGYGREDRFAPAHALLAAALLAAALPADSVDVIDGAHDWPTWSRLWENFLDSRS